MKLEIKLDDPKCCLRCCCLDLTRGYCNNLKIYLKYEVGKCNFPRPQECIDKNGE